MSSTLPSLRNSQQIEGRVTLAVTFRVYMRNSMTFFEASSLNLRKPLLHIMTLHTFINAQKGLSLSGLMLSQGQ